MDTKTVTGNADTASEQPVDDGRRYALTGPRGVSPFLDNLRPDADHHTIAVYGSHDLARRIAEADRLGVCVSWRQLDGPVDVCDDGDNVDGW